MINEIETNQLLGQLDQQQKKELTDHLNQISGLGGKVNSYSSITLDKYIKTRIPVKLLQPIKRWLLNNLTKQELEQLS